MANAANARLDYEAGQTPYAMAALTDSGDHTLFTAAASPWSRRSGWTPVIRVNGLISGGAITPAASGTNNLVDVAAGSAYINGALVTWAADTDVAAVRATSTDTHMITSITVASNGSVAAVAGKDHASAFNEVRDTDGAAPYVATTSIEIGQVRLTSYTAAAITAAEIYQVPGVHQEQTAYPVIVTKDYLNGDVTFATALPLSHTGAVAKGVYASYSVPAFTSVPIASGFEAPENTASVSSTSVYGGTLGSTKLSIGAGKFTAYLEDGVTDSLISFKDEMLWFKFFPDTDASPYHIVQGTLTIKRSWPADGDIVAACTIAAESVGVDVAA